MLFSKFSKWKWDRGRAASLLRGGADSGSHRSFASTRRRSVHRAGSFCKLLFRSARSFEGCPARNRVVFINSGKGCGKRGLYPKAVAPLTWPYACGRSRRPSADENLPISGRSPQFFCHRSSRESAACADECAQASRATRTLGRSCRSDPMPCSSANPSSPCSALPP